MFPFILLLFCSLVVADLRLFHSLSGPFEQRGTIDISGPTLHTVPHDQADLRLVAEDGAFYQVALEPDSESHWAVSTVKACHLLQGTSDTLIVHVTDAGTPFAIDYFVTPVPHDGSCPPPTNRPSKFTPLLNTTILVSSPKLPPLPELRMPPPLTPEGAPVQPVPEKSFIQKYWIYVVVVLGALLLTGAPEEEAPRRGS